MNIAHLMAGAPEGGAELFYERLVLAQSEAGETVLPLFRANQERAARLERLGPRQLAFGGPFDLLTGMRLRAALRRFQPRVVVAWMNRAAGVAPTGPWTLAGRLGGYYDLRYYRRCQHLIGNTRGIVDWIRGQGWPAARVHHLPNFAPNLLGVAPAALPTPPGAPVVLALGRLHRNKAFDVLIRALRYLPGVHAVIAGDGPERSALIDLARRQNVSERLHLLGWRADQAALLAACTVLVCPSRHEPLGNVILEAFSAARPVVAADAAGPVELIVPGQTGLLAAKEDPRALAERIALVLRDPELARGLAEAGRAQYLAHFAPGPVVRQWSAVLETMA